MTGDRSEAVEETTQTDMDMVDATEDETEPPPKIPSPKTPAERAARMKAFRTRTVSTVLMIAAFLVVIYTGHVPLALLVLILQTLMARELFCLAADIQIEKKLPLFRAQQWYFFLVATFYFYLRFIEKNLLVELTSTRHFVELFTLCVKRHTAISYSLYTAGILMFVLSLKRGKYRYQFIQFAWTHMIILIIVVPSGFYMSNIFEGLIWFLLPAFLVIANDIFAYLFGFFFGKTPLIRLSPKKTWEGVIGGFIGTVIFAYFLAMVMSKFNWMICPRKDLSVFQPMHCEQNNPIFVPKTYRLSSCTSALPVGLQEYGSFLVHRLPTPLQRYISELTITMLPMQGHAMVLAAFASIIAPFGGFFASGFKRAMKTKDFGDTIPGHGGVTDRFDCQVMMAIFSYMYYWNFVNVGHVDVGELLSSVLTLSPVEQLELFVQLGLFLSAERELPEYVVAAIQRMTKNGTRLPGTIEVG